MPHTHGDTAILSNDITFLVICGRMYRANICFDATYQCDRRLAMRTNCTFHEKMMQGIEMERTMNAVFRDIFRAIHEGKWMSIEYHNREDQITKYWIGIRDLDVHSRTLSVDGLHLRQYTCSNCG